MASVPSWTLANGRRISFGATKHQTSVPLHRKGRAGVHFSARRNVVVANNLLQSVRCDEQRAQLDGCFQLRAREDLPADSSPAVLVTRDEDFVVFDDLAEPGSPLVACALQV